MVATAWRPGRRERWIPLACLTGSQQLTATSRDLLAFVGGGRQLHAEAERLLADAPISLAELAEHRGGLAFRPSGLRACRSGSRT